MHKVFIAIGTRPEAIKMGKLIQLLRQDPKIELCLCHTGQHNTLIQNVFDLFNITPDVELEAIKHNKSLSSQSAYLLSSLSKLIEKEKPDIVIVQGDTLSCFCGALAAFHNKTPLAHVEAGLRTFNKYGPYPEEMYRTMVDEMADIVFPPTLKASKNLKFKSTTDLLVTGNTGIDALFYINEKLEQGEITVSPSLLKLERDIIKRGNKMLLVTLHRREIHGKVLNSILDELNKFVREHKVELILPVHKNPVVSKAIKTKMKSLDKIHLIKSLDYTAFIWCMKKSLFIVSDSGGVQEEGPSLGKRVVVLRDETEREEATGKINIIAGTKRKEIRLALKTAWKNPEVSKKNFFGDGKASLRILNFLKLKLKK